MNQHRRFHKLAGISMAVICCLASLGPKWKEDYNPPREPTSYVRPPQQEESTRLVLQTMGTYSVGFEYQIPADKQAVFTFLARNEKQIIKSLTKVVTICPPREPNRQSVRLTMIDPSKFTEGYTGKVRWVFNLASNTQEVWEPGLYATALSRSVWTVGETVNDPEMDRDYRLWEIKAYPPDLNMTTDDSPTIFDYQILFRMEPRKTPLGSGRVSVEDYERVMKERKEGLEKK